MLGLQACTIIPNVETFLIDERYLFLAQSVNISSHKLRISCDLFPSLLLGFSLTVSLGCPGSVKYIKDATFEQQGYSKDF